LRSICAAKARTHRIEIRRMSGLGQRRASRRRTRLVPTLPNVPSMPFFVIAIVTVCRRVYSERRSGESLYVASATATGFVHVFGGVCLDQHARQSGVVAARPDPAGCDFVKSPNERALLQALRESGQRRQAGNPTSTTFRAEPGTPRSSRRANLSMLPPRPFVPDPRWLLDVQCRQGSLLGRNPGDHPRRNAHR
jgi:hypothetical protein